MTLLFDYRVLVGGIYVLLFGAIPLRVVGMDSLVAIAISDRWSAWYPPFRTLRLGNRLRRRFVVIERRGMIRYVLLTPDDPEGFLQEVEAARRR